MLRKILVLLLLTSPVFGQGFSSSIARRVQSGTVTPSTCNAGPPTDIFYNTSSGLLLVCPVGNTWTTLQSDATNLSGVVPIVSGGTGNGTGQLTATQGAITASNGAFQATGTLNNAGVTFCIVLCANYTDTASNASSLLMQLQMSSTNKFTVDKSGNLTLAGSATFGATGGQGGTLTIPEGTTATAGSANDICYADSTAHAVKCSWNNGSFGQLLKADNTPVLTSAATLDATAAAHTSPIKSGALGSIPGTCTFTAGSAMEVYLATDATAGQNLYFCTATNTWTQQLNSSSGAVPLVNSSSGTAYTINQFCIPTGGISCSATETARQFPVTAGTYTKAILHTQSAQGATASTLTLNKNGSACNGGSGIVITVTANAAAGNFTGTGSCTVVDGDLLDWAVTVASTATSAGIILK